MQDNRCSMVAAKPIEAVLRRRSGLPDRLRSSRLFEVLTKVYAPNLTFSTASLICSTEYAK